MKEPVTRLPREPVSVPATTKRRSLARLLTGHSGDVELPCPAEIARAAAVLASGVRRRVLVPLRDEPLELAMERRGDDAYVSLYSTTSQPEVALRDRRVPLRGLLVAAAAAAAELGEHDPARALARHVAERTGAAELTPLPADDELTVRGGAHEAPARAQALAFGYELTLRGAMRGRSRVAQSDVHALLADGTLVAFVHGRRVGLARGAILLVVMRMLTAARSVAEACAAGQVPHVRARLGGASITLRAAADGTLSVTLEGERGDAVTAASLPMSEALGPIARLGADLVKELVAFDRTQGRNLRLRNIREDIRIVRRLGKTTGSRGGFVNQDKEHFDDTFSSERESEVRESATRTPTALRFGERWRVALDGLDADGTFLCGDQLLVSSSKHTVAVRRDDGTIAWVRECDGHRSLLAGDVLLRTSPDGHVELCSTETGEAFAETRIAARGSVREPAILVNTPSTPPLAILREQPTRLVAIDLRTGELAWRFAVRRGRPLETLRRGRLLVVLSDEGIHGIDGVSGEEHWRHVDPERAPHSVALLRDRVYVAYDESSARVVQLEAGTGRVQRETRPRGRLAGAVRAHASSVLVPVRHDGASRLVGFDGSLVERFQVNDPGLARGAATLAFDGSLVVNVPAAETACIDLETGAERWTARLARPSDDVPRRLEPQLRSGALFVPTAGVHLLRPADGAALTTEFPCDLVPDRLLVDERSWVYVAEESGHVAAYAPVAHLTLIRGGR